MDIGEILDLAEAYAHELPSPAPLAELPQGSKIAAWIDHTLLKPEATAEQVKVLCQEAMECGFATVCVNPAFVSLASGLLKNSSVGVCSVVGFPLGATTATLKALEALACLEAGASEIDMVMNVGALKGEAYGQVFNDMLAVLQVAHHQGAIVKVILEMALLSQKEKIIACLIAAAAGVDFVKTSTGFGPGGAKVEDVDLMHRLVGPAVRVKAAGGIKTYPDALAMIKAGASRLGASAGVGILKEATGT